jgi:hypothetical protein
MVRARHGSDSVCCKCGSLLLLAESAGLRVHRRCVWLWLHGCVRLLNGSLWYRLHVVLLLEQSVRMIVAHRVGCGREEGNYSQACSNSPVVRASEDCLSLPTFPCSHASVSQLCGVWYFEVGGVTVALEFHAHDQGVLLTPLLLPLLHTMRLHARDHNGRYIPAATYTLINSHHSARWSSRSPGLSLHCSLVSRVLSPRQSGAIHC